MKRVFLLVLLISGLTLFLSGCSLFNSGPNPANWQPDVSPDGESIVFASKEGDNYQIYVMDQETGDRTQLTNNEFVDSGPRWGPEGERIVFTSQRDDNVDVYMMNADGTDVTRLTQDSSQDINPTWNGAGKVLFNSDRTGKWEIFSISLDTNQINQVTETSED